MPSKKLSSDEAVQIQETLDLARKGQATLTQLAVAHDLANGAVLNGCLGEIRTHIHRMVSPPHIHTEGKDLALGVVSGFVTHFLLHRLSLKR